MRYKQIKVTDSLCLFPEQNVVTMLCTNKLHKIADVNYNSLNKTFGLFAAFLCSQRILKCNKSILGINLEKPMHGFST